MRLAALLTCPTFGHWLKGDARGIVRCEDVEPDWLVLPEPDPDLTAQRQSTLKWPMVRLEPWQQAFLREDLWRIARLRQFTIDCACVEADHLHLLYEPLEDQPDLHRQVQLIKGSLARTLSLALEDEPARSPRGEALPHHKWWAREYVLQVVTSAALRARAVSLISTHPDPEIVRADG